MPPRISTSWPRQFTRNAEARGAKVFRTDDPAKVREYILELAQKTACKSVVKSKSMASEEIHLNPYLEKAGIEVARDRPGRVDHSAGRPDARRTW